MSNIEYPTLEQINKMHDNHILIEDAEMCIQRAQHTLNTIHD